jgi:hypothetical protein
MGASHGMLDPGNVSICAPYFISGKSGALTVPAAAAAVATLQNLGRIDENTGVLVPVPLRITQLRIAFATTSGAAATVAFEAFKGLLTTQHTAGGGATRIPTRRKTSGYRAITAAEVNLFVASTAAITGGSFTPEGDGFLMASGGEAAAFGTSLGSWGPSDLCPITLEVGEGIEIRVAQQGSAVGILHVCFDFLRQ